jgi:hypothetical protein
MRPLRLLVVVLAALGLLLPTAAAAVPAPPSTTQSAHSSNPTTELPLPGGLVSVDRDDEVIFETPEACLRATCPYESVEDLLQVCGLDFCFRPTDTGRQVIAVLSQDGASSPAEVNVDLDVYHETDAVSLQSGASHRDCLSAPPFCVTWLDMEALATGAPTIPSNEAAFAAKILDWRYDDRWVYGYRNSNGTVQVLGEVLTKGSITIRGQLTDWKSATLRTSGRTLQRSSAATVALRERRFSSPVVHGGPYNNEVNRSGAELNIEGAGQHGTRGTYYYNFSHSWRANNDNWTTGRRTSSKFRCTGNSNNTFPCEF